MIHEAILCKLFRSFFGSVMFFTWNYVRREKSLNVLCFKWDSSEGIPREAFIDN